MGITSGLPLAALAAIFAASAAIIWFAGLKLAATTAILSVRLNLGKAPAGIIVLAIATNLPEIAITVSAALSGQVGLDSLLVLILSIAGTAELFAVSAGHPG